LASGWVWSGVCGSLRSAERDYIYIYIYIYTYIIAIVCGSLRSADFDALWPGRAGGTTPAQRLLAGLERRLSSAPGCREVVAWWAMTESWQVDGKLTLRLLYMYAYIYTYIYRLYTYIYTYDSAGK
jgi:hypothetical protein